MTAPPPSFTGPISAAEDLTAAVARRLGDQFRTNDNLFSADEVIAALLAGGQIREEWGARYHNPDGDVDTWRDTRDEAERTITARYRGVAPWPHPSSLVRQFVIVTAPEAVT